MRPIRLAGLLVGVLTYTAIVAADPAMIPPSERTLVDHEQFSFELPGRWQERPTSDGYELQRVGEEQVLVAVYPPMEGLDATTSAQRLSAIQWNVLTDLCKRGAQFGKVARVANQALTSLRFHVTCQEPRMVATLLAGSGQGKTITYEQYRYYTARLTPEIERSAAAILDTLRIKPPVSSCPADLLARADSNNGTCLEAAALGDTVVAACARLFESRGWLRDDAAATAMGKQTGKKLVCYRRAEADGGPPR